MSSSTPSSEFPALPPGLVAALLALPPPPGKTLAFGTAGFRDKAVLLESTFMRMGVLAALRSMARGGQVIGLMVTASHNSVEDNGVKIVDPEGGMLAMDWEKHAAALANATSEQELVTVLTSLLPSSSSSSSSSSPRVWIARDTRPHSLHLSSLAIEGALLLVSDGRGEGGREGGQGAVLDLGLLTTPQLHHCIRMENGRFEGGKKGGKEGAFLVPGGTPAWQGEGGYIHLLSSAYLTLLSTAAGASPSSVPLSLPPSSALWVDCAHGIGALKLPAVLAAINEAATSEAAKLDVTLVNTAEEENAILLNDACGAEFVQKGQKPPKGMEKEKDKGKRWASLDGDADRLVYHYFDQDGHWHLLDGDKMAVLAADFLMDALRESGLPPPEVSTGGDGGPGGEWKVAVVQTAYANGASTRYLREKGVPVAFAKTGVKFVHHEAEKYDLGIYFEANGHGTVLFSEALSLALLAHHASFAEGGAEDWVEEKLKQKVATTRLISAQQLINQAVGDAMSDLLFIEAVLRLKGWDVSAWAQGLYTDLPSKQLKLQVPDRTVVSCNADETRALTPPSLQERLDALMAAPAVAPHGRVFVRPSGTEDVVRVYAEADTPDAAAELAAEAARIVQEMVGTPPKQEGNGGRTGGGME